MFIRTRAGASGGGRVGRYHLPTCPVVSPGPKRWIGMAMGASLLVLLAAPAQAASALQQ
jgi:hypothetical protein